jgi:RNA polymerase sigma factor (sigma-70 family)
LFLLAYLFGGWEPSRVPLGVMRVAAWRRDSMHRRTRSAVQDTGTVKGDHRPRPIPPALMSAHAARWLGEGRRSFAKVPAREEVAGRNRHWSKHRSRPRAEPIGEDNGVLIDSPTQPARRTTATVPRHHGPSLGHLVSDARRGSVAAFDDIYRRLAGQVSSYLRWHRASDPDGLTNDVFAQVHRNLSRFRGDEDRFRSWLFTIAHHKMIDDRRRASRQPRVQDELGVEEYMGLGDVEDDAFAALSEDSVRDMLTVLSPDQRDVVLLRIVADLSVDEVARMLGKREGAIKALQHRALAALRRHLDHTAIAV